MDHAFQRHQNYGKWIGSIGYSLYDDENAKKLSGQWQNARRIYGMADPLKAHPPSIYDICHHAEFANLVVKHCGNPLYGPQIWSATIHPLGWDEADH